MNRSNIFLIILLKQKKKKAKKDKLDLIKLKSFHTAKETTDPKKKKNTEQMKICADDMTNKQLISKIYKELIKLNIKKQLN